MHAGSDGDRKCENTAWGVAFPLPAVRQEHAVQDAAQAMEI